MRRNISIDSFAGRAPNRPQTLVSWEHLYVCAADSDDYERPIVSLYSLLPVGVVTAVIVVAACVFATRGKRQDHHDRVSESSGP
ncbi:hypothetical protein [Rhodococcus sp. 06-462-5]|uniref:hypothetical protein n=1 Tax=Rhodococcus sp. 06-462-5 TaxID=2022484 RepID=UPI001179EA53|nr:hypothetical protein [Rhodococcus sp. 06-462-5]